MKQVLLESLHCTTAEDWTGADECRLEIDADGELEFTFRAGLNHDWMWPLNTSVPIDRAREVRLFDEDRGFHGDDDARLHVGLRPAPHGLVSVLA